MERWFWNLRMALRGLLRAPGFAALVVATMALAIGANAAIFSLLDQVLLRPLPVERPNELVLFDAQGPFRGHVEGTTTSLSFPVYRALRESTREVFSGLAGRYTASLQAEPAGEPERAFGELVTGGYFGTLGLEPALGRLLGPGDDQAPGAHPLVVLSWDYWQRHYGGDPGVVGRALRVNGSPLEIVGVAPRGFRGTEVGRASDLFLPMMQKRLATPTQDNLDSHWHRWMVVIARLAPGVDRERARAGAQVAYRAVLAEQAGQLGDAPPEWVERFRAGQLLLLDGSRGTSNLRTAFGSPLTVLLAMVGLVLLVACANVAGLLLARAAARAREIAVRRALGASTGALLGQLLAESLALSTAGGVLGVLLSSPLAAAMVRLLPDAQTTPLSTAIDGRVLAFSAAVTVLSALLFGLAPGLAQARRGVGGALHEGGSRAAGVRRQTRLRRALVVSQVALSLLLLVGAGLFGRTLANLRALDPGLEPESVLGFAIDVAVAGYDDARAVALFPRLEERLAALPGVRGTATVLIGLLEGNQWRRQVRVQGYEPPEGERMVSSFDAVGPGFFSTLGIPLLAGRDFGAADRDGSPWVAVVNAGFANSFFGSVEAAVGRRMGFGRGDGHDVEIIGVVGDARGIGMRDEIGRWFYMPLAQTPRLDTVTVYLRTAGDPMRLLEPARAAVREIDPQLAPFDVSTLERRIEESLFGERMVALLSSAFAGLATLLAALGIYGLLAFSVTLRRREIGVRMAVGAQRASVLAMVVGEGARLGALGVAIGLPVALAAGRLVAAQLYGVDAFDPLTLGAAALAVGSVALAAGFAPAARASRVEPASVLRAE